MKKKNKFILMSITFLGTLFLSSCDSQSLSDSMTNNIIDALIPNFWAFLTQFLALVVLIVLISIFAYKPLRNYMDKRSEFLDNEVKTATKNNAISKENLEKSEESIADSKKQAVQIVEEAKNSANVERKKILDSADAEALEMKEKAKLEIKNERKNAEKQVRNEIINVALDASKQVISREINKDDNKKIIDDFVTTMDKAKNTEKEIEK